MLGERHPDYATGLNNLAWLLQAQGDYAAARPLYEQMLAIQKQVDGGRNFLLRLRTLTTWPGCSSRRETMLLQGPLYEQSLAI